MSQKLTRLQPTCKVNQSQKDVIVKQCLTNCSSDTKMSIWLMGTLWEIPSSRLASASWDLQQDSGSGLLTFLRQAAREKPSLLMLTMMVEYDWLSKNGELERYIILRNVHSSQKLPKKRTKNLFHVRNDKHFYQQWKTFLLHKLIYYFVLSFVDRF